MLPAMGANNSPEQDELRVFHTGDHACGYWPTRIARDLVLDPRDPRMVEMALAELQKNGVVHLDEERKAAMVSNLLVVLCGERATQPGVNAGTLY